MAITYTGYISTVTINGTTISNGWSGVIKSGDKIIVHGSMGSDAWYYDDGGGYIGGGSSVTCTAPSSSGTGTLSFYDAVHKYNDIGYRVSRGGICRSWTFNN